MAHLIWEGKSLYTGEAVILAASGVDRLSENPKTGPMAQTWVLTAGTSPIEAVKTGADAATCGSCRLRGDGTGKGRACYVTPLHGPQVLWRQHRDGALKPVKIPWRRFWERQVVRLGAYGDHAAVPTEVTAAIAKNAAGHTGYTHGWRNCDPGLKRWLMASCDSQEEADEARSMGWRTFRARHIGDALSPGEIQCPADARKGITCLLCRKCAGGEGKDVSIEVHGNGKKHF